MSSLLANAGISLKRTNANIHESITELRLYSAVFNQKQNGDPLQRVNLQRKQREYVLAQTKAVV
jgi:hypothetical protein